MFSSYRIPNTQKDKKSGTHSLCCDTFSLVWDGGLDSVYGGHEAQH